MRELGAGRRGFADVAKFAGDVRGELTDQLIPAKVYFRGSFAKGSYDNYSDVDLLAEVGSELDGGFFCALEHRLTGLYGSALVRYDPDHEASPISQHVRFSFYELPVFWRVDLEVVSSVEANEKGPLPFPKWQVGTSALMNVVWAIKYHRRGRAGEADHYIASACGKLDLSERPYTMSVGLEVLEILEERRDTDRILLAKTREAVRE